MRWQLCPSHRGTSSSSHSAVGSLASAISSSRSTCGSPSWRSSGPWVGCSWRLSSSTASRTRMTTERTSPQQARPPRLRLRWPALAASRGSRDHRRSCRPSRRRPPTTKRRTALRPWRRRRGSCNSSTCCRSCRASTRRRCYRSPSRASRRAASGVAPCSCRRPSAARRVGCAVSLGRSFSASRTSGSLRSCAFDSGEAPCKSASRTRNWRHSQRCPLRSPRM
mmetsp:Transcript_1959/g.5488  ORF Transcript_1959/g.5488 Transcript_1959/m.5488 type:complete len:223 (+) Transcript_1959:469-1137(+)